MTVIVVVVIVVAIPPEADAPRLAGQLQDVHPIANAVDDNDVAAVVDFDVVGHVGVIGSGRYIEPRLHGPLRDAEIPRAPTCGAVRAEGRTAVVRISAVLLGRMRSEALTPQAGVATRICLSSLRSDP